MHFNCRINFWSPQIRDKSVLLCRPLKIIIKTIIEYNAFESNGQPLIVYPSRTENIYIVHVWVCVRVVRVCVYDYVYLCPRPTSVEHSTTVSCIGHWNGNENSTQRKFNNDQQFSHGTGEWEWWENARGSFTHSQDKKDIFMRPFWLTASSIHHPNQMRPRPPIVVHWQMTISYVKWQFNWFLCAKPFAIEMKIVRICFSHRPLTISPIFPFPLHGPSVMRSIS